MQATQEIKIVLIDDHRLFREGIKQILKHEPSFCVVAEGDDVSEAIGFVKNNNPDVILMGINAFDTNGFEVMNDLVRNCPKTRVIILSNHDNKNYVTWALKAGIQGYLLKEMDSNDLIDAIKVVSEGGYCLHPKVIHILVQEYRQLARNRSKTAAGMIERQWPLHLLTKRECEVLQSLADGKSNKGISDALHISEKTVKNHISNILQKLECRDRTQAVVQAIRNSWVKLL